MRVSQNYSKTRFRINGGGYSVSSVQVLTQKRGGSSFLLDFFHCDAAGRMSIYTGAEIPLVTIFEGIPKKQAAGPLNPVDPPLQKRPAAVPKQPHFGNNLNI